MLTKKELAKELKVSERTIDRWRKQGLPCYAREKFIRFEMEKVLEWIRGGN